MFSVIMRVLTSLVTPVAEQMVTEVTASKTFCLSFVLFVGSLLSSCTFFGSRHFGEPLAHCKRDGVGVVLLVCVSVDSWTVGSPFGGGEPTVRFLF